MQDLETYLLLRDQIKAMELPALKTIAANPHEPNAKRGLASYYVFINAPLPEGCGGSKSGGCVKEGKMYWTPVQAGL